MYNAVLLMRLVILSTFLFISVAVVNSWSDLVILCHCVVPENIHTAPLEGLFGLSPHLPGNFSLKLHTKKITELWNGSEFLYCDHTRFL